jgi:hypothetical protein
LLLLLLVVQLLTFLLELLPALVVPLLLLLLLVMLCVLLVVLMRLPWSQLRLSLLSRLLLLLRLKVRLGHWNLHASSWRWAVWGRRAAPGLVSHGLHQRVRQGHCLQQFRWWLLSYCQDVLDTA